MKKISLLLIICCHLQGLHADANPKPLKANYLKVKAKAGQGAMAILREYKVLEYKCLLDQFYKINNLKPGTELSKSKSYLLPIKQEKFDGKSIRTSIGISDYDLAKKIEKYNDAVHASKLQKQNFKKSKVLWVPEFTSECIKEDLITAAKSNKSEILTKTKTITEEKEITKPINTKPDSNARTLVAERKITNDDEDSDTSSEKNTVEIGHFKRVSNKKIQFGLFGSKYKNIDIESDELKNHSFYIVPGHGGPDPGAVAKNIHGSFDACEDEYAYDVCLRLARELMQKGAEVFVIVQDKNDGIRDEMYLDCDTDEVCMGNDEIPISQKKRLRQGMKKVNALYHKNKHKTDNHWMISIHVDSRPSEDRQDVFFYYQADSDKGKSKTKDIQQVFANKYETYQNREYTGHTSSRPLYVIRASRPEPIFIELGNILNEKDRERILKPTNRQLLADWITEAFVKE